jgi:acyl-CoA reductase-like NAD-dependent aldehyde dehydrogenase
MPSDAADLFRVYKNFDPRAKIIRAMCYRVLDKPETEVGPLINPREADRVTAWIDEAVSAGALINDHTAFRTDWMPFAGRRQSGYGVGGIPWSMQSMSQDKMIVLRQDG